MPAKGLHHIDLAVSDVERSLAFYLNLLGPLGWKVTRRYPTYRGTEEVVYLGTGEAYAVVGNAGPDAGGIGLRPADGGAHQYYGVGVEHIAFDVDTKDELRTRTPARRHPARRSTSRPRRTVTSRATTRSSHSIPTVSGSKCSPGRQSRDRSSHCRRDIGQLEAPAVVSRDGRPLSSPEVKRLGLVRLTGVLRNG
jgi:catechol 2,3-dioxygenase-like lactoylglutathione lyase family enzyme